MYREEDAGIDRGHGVAPGVIALLLGVVVLVFGSFLVPAFAPRQPIEVLIAAGAAIGALLWVAALLVALRRGPWALIVGGLVLLAGGGALAGWGANRIYAARTTTDASSFAEIEIGPDGMPKLPRGAADRGPLSRRYSELLAADAADRQALSQAMGALNPAALDSSYLLDRDPRVLAQCNAFEAVKARVRAVQQAHAARIAALKAEVAAQPMPDALKEGIVTVVAPETNGGAMSGAMPAQLALLDASREQCMVLARRHWVDVEGFFAFSSSIDREQVAALKARRKQLASEQAAAERAINDRLLLGREQVREALR